MECGRRDKEIVINQTLRVIESESKEVHKLQTYIFPQKLRQLTHQ